MQPLPRLPRSYRGGEALKLSTSVSATANYPKSSSLGHFKSNLRSTLTQTSGSLRSQQRLNKQPVQRIRYSTLRRGGGLGEVGWRGEGGLGQGGVKAKGKQLLIWKKTTAPISNSFCSNALDGAGGRGQKVAGGGPVPTPWIAR